MEYITSWLRDDSDSPLSRILNASPEELSQLSANITLLHNVIDRDGVTPERLFELATLLVMHTRTSYIEEGIHVLQMLSARQDAWRSRLCSRHNTMTAVATVQQSPRGWRVGRSSSGSGSDGDDGGVGNDAKDSRGGVVPTISHRVTSSVRARAAQSGSDGRLQRGTLVVGATAPPPSDDDVVVSVHCAQRDGDDGGAVALRGAGGRGGDGADTIAPGEMPDVAFYSYYLAIGYLKLRQMDSAMCYVRRVLECAPQHHQANALKAYIEQQQHVDTVAGTMTVAGLVLLGGTLLGGALLGRLMYTRRKRDK